MLCIKLVKVNNIKYQVHRTDFDLFQIGFSKNNNDNNIKNNSSGNSSSRKTCFKLLIIVPTISNDFQVIFVWMLGTLYERTASAMVMLMPRQQ